MAGAYSISSELGYSHSETRPSLATMAAFTELVGMAIDLSGAPKVMSTKNPDYYSRTADIPLGDDHLRCRKRVRAFGESEFDVFDDSGPTDASTLLTVSVLNGEHRPGSYWKATTETQFAEMVARLSLALDIVD